MGSHLRYDLAHMSERTPTPSSQGLLLNKTAVNKACMPLTAFCIMLFRFLGDRMPFIQTLCEF